MPATDHRAAIEKLRREALSSGPGATASGTSRPYVEENLVDGRLFWAQLRTASAGPLLS